MAVVLKRSLSEKIFNYFNIFTMIFICILTIYPIFNILAISLSGDNPVLRGEITFYPIEFSFSTYLLVFENNALMTSYLNTIFVASIGCIISLLFTSFASYPLAYSKFIGKKFTTFIILFTMWFSGGMIPTYLVVREVGLFNSLWALIIVPLVSAYNVIILTTFFKSLPISLNESAKMDGANDFSILFRITLPLAKPVIATVALWIIVAHWNDFFAPLMYLRDYKKYTLQIVLRDIVFLNSGLDYGIGDTGGDLNASLPEQVKAAVIFASMLPMLMIYPFLQKYFVKGVMIGALKE